MALQLEYRLNIQNDQFFGQLYLNAEMHWIEHFVNFVLCYRFIGITPSIAVHQSCSQQCGSPTYRSLSIYDVGGVWKYVGSWVGNQCRVMQIKGTTSPIAGSSNGWAAKSWGSTGYIKKMIHASDKNLICIIHHIQKMTFSLIL